MKTYVGQVCKRIAADIREYGVAGAAFVLYAVVSGRLFGAFCPMVILCGLPCPGCGVSRAAVCLLTGRWRQAWQFNPTIFPIGLAAAYFGWNRYFLDRRARGMKEIVIALAALLLIVYGLRMYLYFPHQIPCVYTENNVLARLLGDRYSF